MTMAPEADRRQDCLLDSKLMYRCGLATYIQPHWKCYHFERSFYAELPFGCLSFTHSWSRLLFYHWSHTVSVIRQLFIIVHNYQQLLKAVPFLFCYSLSTWKQMYIKYPIPYQGQATVRLTSQTHIRKRHSGLCVFSTVYNNGFFSDIQYADIVQVNLAYCLFYNGISMCLLVQLRNNRSNEKLCNQFLTL